MTDEESSLCPMVAECVACDSVTVKKFQSSRTGITIIVANVPGPLVHGFFVVATEAENDDGLPHTLEHLIFLGSADYPYKGTLDILANRCLASGTNAWTDIDHTAYTVSTAGADGFLVLFPVYLDHLFFPTLTDAGFVTEVYHITGEGKDAGVVFCEMQHYESSAELLTQLELMKGLYAGKCGYRYETGGAVGNLRRSTSIEKIRKYHKKYYRAENLTIIVTGLIEENKILKALEKFEDKLLNSDESLKFSKAWQEPVPLLHKSNVKAVTYPSDKEDHGVVLIGWQGPSVVSDYYSMIAATILFNYLVETAASPLMKYFVETDDPFCSDVTVSVVENSTSAIYLTFKNVVIERMPYLSDQLFRVLLAVAENKDDNFQFDHTRMNIVIERFVLKQLLALEKEPQNEITTTLISDVLYGNSYNDMFDRLNHHVLAEKLKKEDLSFWCELLKSYFVHRPHVTVLGYPSKKDRVLRSYFENERRNNQVNNLGPEGLKRKDETLNNATKENEKLPPDELIASVDIPNVNNLNFHTIGRFTSSTEHQHSRFNVKLSPVFTQLDDIKSHFVYLYTIMDSSNLPTNVRIYLPLFLEYILECPIYRNGEFISHETVAKELETDVIKFKSCLGLWSDRRFSCGSHSSAVTLSMVILPRNFERAIRWIRDVLFHSSFVRDRLKVVVRKLISSISQIRRQGNVIVKDLMKIMIFQKSESNHGICSVLSQLKFLSHVADQLANDEEADTVIRDLETLRSCITQPGNFILHISADACRLADLYPNSSDVLSRIIPDSSPSNNIKMTIDSDKHYLSLPLDDKKYKNCVVGMANVDSAYLYHCCASISDFQDPDLPALLVFIQFITQLEGPMWRDVRGFGLAYHYDVKLSAEDGVLFLIFSRASDVVQAFRRTQRIFVNCMSTTLEWNILHFESAKSSLIFEIAEREKNVISLANESLLAHLMNTSAEYNRQLIQKVKNVQLIDMDRIGRRYIAPLFDREQSFTAILCDQSIIKEIVDGFEKLGRELIPFSSLEDSYMNSVPLPENIISVQA